GGRRVAPRVFPQARRGVGRGAPEAAASARGRAGRGGAVRRGAGRVRPAPQDAAQRAAGRGQGVRRTGVGGGPFAAAPGPRGGARRNRGAVAGQGRGGRAGRGRHRRRPAGRDAVAGRVRAAGQRAGRAVRIRPGRGPFCRPGRGPAKGRPPMTPPAKFARALAFSPVRVRTHPPAVEAHLFEWYNVSERWRHSWTSSARPEGASPSTRCSRTWWRTSGRFLTPATGSSSAPTRSWARKRASSPPSWCTGRGRAPAIITRGSENAP